MEDLFQIQSTSTDSDALPASPSPSRPRARRRIFLLGLVLVVLFIAATLFGVGRFLTGGIEAEERFDEAQEALLAFEFDLAKDELASTEEAIRVSRSGLMWLSPFRLLPWVGDQIAALSLTLSAAEESLSALGSAVDIIDDVYQVIADAEERLSLTELDHSFTLADLDDEARIELFTTLHQSTSKLQEMQVEISIAIEELSQLESLRVHEDILALIQPFQEVLPTIAAGIDLLTPVAASISELSGLGEDRQWLVLFLNDNEMRPGGGFIGVFGLLLMQDGEIQTFQVDDAMAVDSLVTTLDEYQIAPPSALADYVGVDRWYFRDSNWSPDIPTASSDARTLFRQEYSAAGQPVPEVHGVLSFSLSFAAAVIDVVGPITVDGIEFTGDNLSEVLQYDVEFGYQDRNISWDERKAIVGTLADVVLAELLSLPVNSWEDMITTIAAGFEEKHLALYSEDEETQDVFVDAGWAASFDPVSDDVLMLVDANMAALKTDPYVDRQIDYSITPDEEGYIARADVTYNHTGVFSDLVTRYRTYTRLYVPLGSELLDSSGSLVNDALLDPTAAEGEVTVADDLGYTSFGAFISIEPGAEGTLSFTYRLPPDLSEAIDRGYYELWVEKQMSAAPYTLTLDLDFDKKIRAAYPEEDEEAFGNSAYELNTILDQSTGFTVEF